MPPPCNTMVWYSSSSPSSPWTRRCLLERAQGLTTIRFTRRRCYFFLHVNCCALWYEHTLRSIESNRVWYDMRVCPGILKEFFNFQFSKGVTRKNTILSQSTTALLCSCTHSRQALPSFPWYPHMSIQTVVVVVWIHMQASCIQAHALESWMWLVRLDHGTAMIPQKYVRCIYRGNLSEISEII